MSEVVEYECDSCGKREIPGPRVVGWLAVVVARMILPSQMKEGDRKGATTKEFCSEDCYRIGLAAMPVPEAVEVPKKQIADLVAEVHRHDSTHALPTAIGQYL